MPVGVDAYIDPIAAAPNPVSLQGAKRRDNLLKRMPVGVDAHIDPIAAAPNPVPLQGAKRRDNLETLPAVIVLKVPSKRASL